MFRKTILVTVASLFLFASCDQATGDIQNVEELSKIPLGIRQMKSLNYSVDEIGQYHNEVLGAFMKNNPKYELSSFESLISDLKVTGQKLYGQKYQDLLIVDDKYQLQTSSFTLASKGDKSFSEMIKEAYEGMVSIEVQIVLDYIVENELPYESTHSYITDYIKSNDLSDSDKEVLEAFDIFASYSDKYWAEYPSNSATGKSTFAKGCTPRSQQYLADGFGFLIGGGLGALGYSAAIHVLQDEGSHCI